MASMTYLQCTKELASESGSSGGYDGVVTCQSQSGEIGRLCRWIQKAYLDIQEMHQDWGWLLQPVSFTTVSQQFSYTPAQCGVTNLGMWKEKSFRSYVTATGTNTEILLAPATYDNWRDAYQYGSFRTTYQRPLVYAESPYDKSLCLGPTPDATGYTIVGEYFKAPADFSADLDVPVLPTKFHMAIVWRALIYYGTYESAPEALARGTTEFNRLIRQMESDQLPTIAAGDPLA